MDILGFVGILSATQSHMDHGDKGALDKAGAHLEAEIKKNIGTYNLGWPPLAPSTVEKKGADTPLLESGKGRDSIEHQVVSHEAVEVGTNEQHMVYQELGTPKIPPRSFLVATAMEKEAELVEILGSPMTHSPLLVKR